MSTILYTTHCPQCKVISAKLDNKNIPYEIEEDIDVMREKGFLSAPNLEVDGVVYNFNEARKLIDAFDETMSFEQFCKKGE